MKINRFFWFAVMSLSLAWMVGCKYPVSSPLWDQPYTTPPTPVITSVDPAAEAQPGVNTITIHGHNLVVTVQDTAVPNSTIVYFNNTQAEVVSADSNMLVVRRPNLVVDSCMIKVAPHNSITEATYSPYKIYQVVERFGGFLQNLPLGAIAVNNSENLYVIETTNKYIHKVTPAGDNTILGGGTAKTTQSPFGSKIGPDGNLYVTENNRSIEKVDLTAETVSRWTQLPSGKVVKSGDFGPGGYFYAGGARTDLCIVPPNPPATLSASDVKTPGSYASDDILAIHVYNGYVYVASRTYGTQNPVKIWRNRIIADNVGAQELVLDFGATGEFSSRVVNDIAFSSNGVMFVATDGDDPILSFDMNSQKMDIYYKGIVPPYCKRLAWGKANYLYLVNGDATAGQTWTVYRLDMGITGAP